MLILETPRLLLRHLTADDIDPLYKILSNPETMSFWPAPLTQIQCHQWIEGAQKSYKQHGFGRCAVILKSTGELIGDCGIAKSEVNKVLENDLGYILDKNFWGQGLATEMAQALLHYGQNILKLERIVINMPKDHSASKHVAEKLGLKLDQEFKNVKNRHLPTLLFVT